MHTSDYLRYLRRKQTATHLPTTPEKCHCRHYLVKCTIFFIWVKVSCIPPNVSGFRGLALAALKRTSCDVWQMACQASNVAANVQSDHFLHRYMLPVFFATDKLHRPLRSAEIQPTRRPQLVRMADWYSILTKNMKIWKICAVYKVVQWRFSGMVGKGV